MAQLNYFFGTVVLRQCCTALKRLSMNLTVIFLNWHLSLQGDDGFLSQHFFYLIDTTNRFNWRCSIVIFLGNSLGKAEKHSRTRSWPISFLIFFQINLLIGFCNRILSLLLLPYGRKCNLCLMHWLHEWFWEHHTFGLGWLSPWPDFITIAQCELKFTLR